MKHIAFHQLSSIKKHSWMHQVAQDTISYYFDVPIRSIHIDELDHVLHDKDVILLTEIYKNVVIQDNTTYAEKFFEFSEKIKARGKGFIVSVMEKQAKLWSSDGSYSNPFLTMMRQNRLWRIWEISTMLSALDSSIENKLFNDIDVYLLDGYFTAKIIKTDKRVLYIGPVWSWFRSKIDLTELDSYNLRKNCVDLAYSIASSHGLNNNPLITEKRLSRLFGARAAPVRQDYLSRVNDCRIAFNIIDQIDILSHDGSSYEDVLFGSNHCKSIAYITLLTRFDLNILDHTTKNIRFMLAAPLLDETEESETSFASPIEFEIENRKVGSVQLIFDDADKYKLHSESTRLLYTPDVDQNVMSKFEITISKTVDKVHTSRNLYLSERSTILRYISEDNFSFYEPDSMNDFHRNLVQSINYHLGSDIASIYRYDPQLDGLEMISSFYRLESEAKFEATTADLMINANERERISSLCYQCFEQDRSILWSSISNSPNTRSLLLPKGDTSAAGSAIAVPININGFPWGVLELRGRQQGQLRQSTVRWAEDYSRTIAMSLHSSQLIRRVHDLNKFSDQALRHIEDGRQSEFEIYEELSKKIVSLFGARSCLIFRKEGEGHPSDNFVCVAVSEIGFSLDALHNNEFDSADERGQNFVLNGNKSRLMAELYGQYCREKQDADGIKFFPKESLARLITDENDVMCSTGIQDLASAAVVEIVNSTDEPIAVLLIGFTIGEPKQFSDLRWSQLSRFCAEYTSLVVNLIEFPTHVFRRAMALEAHEIRNSAIKINAISKQLNEVAGPLAELVDVVPSPLATLATVLREEEGRAIRRQFREPADLLNALSTFAYKSFGDINYSGDLNVADLLYQLESESQGLAFKANENLNVSDRKPQPKWNDFFEIYGAASIEGARRYGHGSDAIVYNGPKRGQKSGIEILGVELHQIEIIRNIIENARKYNIGKRPVDVNVYQSADLGSSSGIKFTLEVVNRSFTVSDDDRMYLTKSGYRSKPAWKYWPSGSGSGLGMSIAAEHCNSMEYEGPLIDLSPCNLSEINQNSEIVRNAIRKGFSLRTESFSIWRISIVVPPSHARERHR